MSSSLLPTKLRQRVILLSHCVQNFSVSAGQSLHYTVSEQAKFPFLYLTKLLEDPAVH